MTLCVLCLTNPAKTFLREQIGSPAYPVCQECVAYMDKIMPKTKVPDPVEP